MQPVGKLFSASHKGVSLTTYASKVGLGGSFSKKYGDDSLESALAMLKELPPEMPVHGLGIGEPGDLLAAISAGVDLFDCVAPTRLGRHGSIYTKHGLIHLKNEKYRSDFTPL